MASTLTTRNAEVSLRAWALGAVDYLPKPSTNREFTFSTDFRRELIEKVRTLGARFRRRGPVAPRHDGTIAPGLPPPAATPAHFPEPEGAGTGQNRAS